MPTDGQLAGKSQDLIADSRPDMLTYPGPIRRLAVLFIVVPHFVEVVLVQLSDETRKVAVFEMLGQDVLSELFVLSTR